MGDIIFKLWSEFCMTPARIYSHHACHLLSLAFTWTYERFALTHRSVNDLALKIGERNNWWNVKEKCWNAILRTRVGVYPLTSLEFVIIYSSSEIALVIMGNWITWIHYRNEWNHNKTKPVTYYVLWDILYWYNSVYICILCYQQRLTATRPGICNYIHVFVGYN